MAQNVAVGLSGGVDSTLSALLLKQQGFNVFGVSMSIYNKDIPQLKDSENACYGAKEKQEIKDIQKLGDKLGIKTYTFDCSEEYKKTILQYFKDSYLAGRTPNPCVKCNELMKFGLLMKKLDSLDIPYDYFATGHYARVEQDTLSGRYLLKKGLDSHKDQSYFLYRLTQTQLARILFPLGNFTKEKVRLLARTYGLEVADKKDSQDFYAGDYNDLLQTPDKQGFIKMTNGTILGTHQGYWHYTRGQRKGLGISYEEPLYVLDLDAHQNIVWVGRLEEAQKTVCFVEDLHWIKYEEPAKEFFAMAKQRSTAKPMPVRVFIEENGLARVIYQTPQTSLTPGQSMVFYENDDVIGGGVICQ